MKRFLLILSVVLIFPGLSHFSSDTKLITNQKCKKMINATNKDVDC